MLRYFTPTFSTDFLSHIRFACVCVRWPVLPSMSFHWRDWQPYIELQEQRGQSRTASPHAAPGLTWWLSLWGPTAPTLQPVTVLTPPVAGWTGATRWSVWNALLLLIITITAALLSKAIRDGRCVFSQSITLKMFLHCPHIVTVWGFTLGFRVVVRFRLVRKASEDQICISIT